MKIRCFGLFFISVFFFNSLNSAYKEPAKNSEKNSEKEMLKVLKSRSVRDNFWLQIRKPFQADNHQELQYLFILNFLFERIKNADNILIFNDFDEDLVNYELAILSSNKLDCWEQKVQTIYAGVFENALSKFDSANSIFVSIKNDVYINDTKFKFILNLNRCFAYALLEDMIVYNEIFKNVQSWIIWNSEKYFLDPVNVVIKSTPSFHKILTIAEVLIFLTNFYKHLSEKKEHTFASGGDWTFISEEKEYVSYLAAKSKESVLIQIISNKWPKSFGTKAWSTMIWNLIENYCKNSSYYHFVRHSSN
jgi:hypothetical protein